MKRFQVLGMCLLLAVGAQAQEVYNSSGRSDYSTQHKKKEGFDKDRLIIGGGANLSLGDYTDINIAPKIGYRITDHFAAGVGLGYEYLNVKDFFPVYNGTIGDYEYFPLKSSFIYPSVWARYIIWKNLFVHAEFEYDFQHFKVYSTDNDPSSSTYGTPVSSSINYHSPALLLGPGYRQPITDRASFTIMLLYDVIQDQYSPYQGRIFPSFGFNVGF